LDEPKGAQKKTMWTGKGGAAFKRKSTYNNRTEKGNHKETGGQRNLSGAEELLTKKKKKYRDLVKKKKTIPNSKEQTRNLHY